MEVQISYFSKVGQDGNSMTLEQRIQSLVAAADGKNIMLKDNAGSVVATCSNEEELRKALKERGVE